LRKTVFTLDIDNYAPEIKALTYPLLHRYAEKIDAEFVVINKRKFPKHLPPVYEKLQIYTLGKKMGNDWNIYFDGDALVHPDMFDVTDHLPKDTVLHNGLDMAGNRWKYDEYFRRDGRHIGSCNWFTAASDWCLDLWHPLEDLTFEQAVENIQPLIIESNSGVVREHLIDDYVLSRNIARYGLKFIACKDLQVKIGRDKDVYFFHEYLIPVEEKIVLLSQQIEFWGLTKMYEGLPKTRRAASIAGWMVNQELYWLAQQAQTRQNILEMGSWIGRSTRALADNTPGTVHAVDTWLGSIEHQGLPATKESFKYFCHNTADLMSGAVRKVYPVRMESTAAAKMFFERGVKFDMIFIDGAHDYASVKADILAWRPLLAPGGLFCGHDYTDLIPDGSDGSDFGVVQAVDELIHLLKKGPGSLWYEGEQRTPITLTDLSDSPATK
jgi:hypothetical protein